MFKRAKQNRVFQDVVEQVQDAIIEGRLKQGDKLPAERELKDMFNTSRGTLREALRVLEQKGLIEIKLGVAGGAIVKGVDTDPFVESLALLIRSQKLSLEHLSEFRISMEGKLVALAAERATEEELLSMRKLVDESFSSLDKEDYAAVLDIDEKLHTLLGEMSGNPVFQFIQKSIHENIHRYYESYLPMDVENQIENCQDFKALLKAMESKDSQESARIIMSHVERYSARMQARIDGKL